MTRYPWGRATPAYDTPLVALRATLARGGIGLVTRGDGVVAAMAGCRDVVDRLQPDGCYRCILADDRDVAAGVVARIAAVVDRYPIELLAAADIHTLSLCRRLDKITARHTMGGISDTDNRHMMISVSDPEFLPDIVHHELFHMIESARTAYTDGQDPEWERANPTGFSYGAGPSSAEARKTRPPGFVRWYAASTPEEDRASTFEYMLADPDELCELATSDPVLRAKVKIIWSRLKTYTSGDDLMNAIAPCVRSVAWLHQ